VASRLREVEVQVTGAAVLAATQLRRSVRTTVGALPPRGMRRAEGQQFGIPNEG